MSDPTRAVFQVHINGSIQDVWREITRTDGVQLAMFNSRLVTPGLKVGAPIRIRTKSGKYTAIVGEVLEFDPPRRYAHTFRFTRFDDPPCKVIYDLVEAAGGVDFTMTLEDVPPNTRTAKQMMQGGKLIVNTLKNVVETGRPSFGVRVFYMIFGVLEPLFPKRSLAENWPM